MIRDQGRAPPIIRQSKKQSKRAVKESSQREQSKRAVKKSSQKEQSKRAIKGSSQRGQSKGVFYYKAKEDTVVQRGFSSSGKQRE